MAKNWKYSTLREAAPAISNPMPGPETEVWSLSLEDIESGTGRILSQRFCKVSQLGSTKCSFDTSHVLYSKLRPYLNKVVVPDKPGVGTSELIPLKPNPEILDREFLAYYLRSRKFLDFAVSNVQGANLPRVSMRKFWEHKIPLPPLPEQRRIVARIKEMMSRVDEIRKLREEALKETEMVEPAIFADYLQTLSKGKKACKIDTVKLGEILIRSQYGISKKANNNEKGVAILRMGNIRNGYLDTSDMKHIDLNEDEFKKYCLKEGDILINRTNSLELVGKAAVFERVKKDCVFASYLIRLQVDESRALPQFVSSVINSSIGRGYILHTARRAIGMVNINAQEIARMPIPLPPISEQKKLVASMLEARHILSRLMESMTKKAVQAMPEAILQKAFAGEL